MKTTAPLLSISALALALLMAPLAIAEGKDMTEAEAQSYARDLLEPEEERAGLDNIRDEREAVREEDRLQDENAEYLDDVPGMETEQED